MLDKKGKPEEIRDINPNRQHFYEETGSSPIRSFLQIQLALPQKELRILQQLVRIALRPVKNYKPPTIPVAWFVAMVRFEQKDQLNGFNLNPSL